MKEIFDPYRFDRVEVQASEDQVMLDRLAKRIEEYQDLAEIGDWESIMKDRGVCRRLQDAHDIMHNTKMPEFYRCCPCEMEALCAIKHLVKGSSFQEFKNSFS